MQRISPCGTSSSEVDIDGQLASLSCPDATPTDPLLRCEAEGIVRVVTTVETFWIRVKSASGAWGGWVSPDYRASHYAEDACDPDCISAEVVVHLDESPDEWPGSASRRVA